MKEQDELAGIIEEEVKKSNLVDPGLVELELIRKNAPLNELDRREFLVYSAGAVGKFLATLTGLVVLSQSTTSCAPLGAIIRMHADKDWGLNLLKQDGVRGPPLLIHPTGLPSDFEHHRGQWINQGFGAVDYNVPIGTPIVPTANAYSLLAHTGTGFNQGLVILHSPTGYTSLYYHLDGHTDIINQGTDHIRTGSGRPHVFKDQNLNKLKVVGFSGNTGVGPGGGPMPQHLHFEIRKYTKEGILNPDPFELGVDAENPLDEYISSTGKKRASRPVYWDGKTAIYRTPQDRSKGLQQTLDTLDKRVRESNLDSETKKELLKRYSNPVDLRDYLGMRVLLKKRDKEGNLVYDFKPGSLMYALMLEFYTRTSKQEFIAMLPFIYPELKHIYQKFNPNVVV